ncbi:hypothetical protein [Evansella clarkii]|uniref:hypothetical protein n=1 Tax=Evansella clarkii TaxID=79879 RepID=UPI000995F036|nr:hypothetical protein [Evansella clarkii]
MSEKSILFHSKKVIDNYFEIHVVDVKEYSLELIDFINEHFVNICEGASGSNVETVKKRALEFLESKAIGTKMGAIAEFFVHLYLKNLGFKQECMFFNLEENSIKKGFDGYYSFEEVEWIMESKSGSKDSKNSSHHNKITKAYDDLVDKFNGEVKNNPWKNAYNHASQIDVGTEKNIRDNIKKLSDNFTNKKFASINDFHIIPASTIYLEGDWENYDYEDLRSKLIKSISEFKFKEIIVICVTKKSIDLFMDFLYDL